MRFRELFARVGRPLTGGDGVPEKSLATAEKKLGLRLPKSLREYYLLAGRERRFNHAFNRLLGPKEWEVHEGKLIFMAENQDAAFWGVSATARPLIDPGVSVTNLVSGALDSWWPECKRCSIFLEFMIHMHAAFGGGLDYIGSARVGPELLEILDRAWQFAGEVKKMRAYSRYGQVVCYSPWRDVRSENKHWRVFAGSTTREGLEQLARELSMQWD